MDTIWINLSIPTFNKVFFLENPSKINFRFEHKIFQLSNQSFYKAINIFVTLFNPQIITIARPISQL